jgi:hypothetical protein
MPAEIELDIKNKIMFTVIMELVMEIDLVYVSSDMGICSIEFLGGFLFLRMKQNIDSVFSSRVIGSR